MRFSKLDAGAVIFGARHLYTRVNITGICTFRFLRLAGEIYRCLLNQQAIKTVSVESPELYTNSVD